MGPLSAAVVAACTVLGVGLAAAPAAAFAPPYDTLYSGGCWFAAETDGGNQLANPDTYTGHLTGVVAGVAESAGHNPVRTRRLGCALYVNGQLVARTGPETIGYVVAVAPPQPTTFLAPAGAVVRVCETVTLSDAHDQVRDYQRCHDGTRLSLRPTEVDDVTAPYCPTVDAALCGLVRDVRPRVWIGAVPLP